MQEGRTAHQAHQNTHSMDPLYHHSSGHHRGWRNCFIQRDHELHRCYYSGSRRGGRHTHRLWEHLQYHIQSARCLGGGENPERDQHRLPRSKACQRSGAAATSHQVDLGEGSREIASALQTAQGSISKLQRQLGQNMATLSLSMAGGKSLAYVGVVSYLIA